MTPTLQPIPPPDFDNIPAAIKSLDHWVCFRAPPKQRPDGTWKRDKIPVDPKSGRNASSADPSTWGSFDEARAWYEGHRADVAGLGFQFGDGCGVVAIDLDHVLDQEGNCHGEAWDLVQQMATYTEVSPGGDGLHLFLAADAPGVTSDKHPERLGFAVELFASRFFITVTGLRVEGLPEAIEPRQEALAALRKRLAKAAPPATEEAAPGESPAIPEGARNAVLTSLAGTMRRRGLDEPAILAALLEHNAARCSPPLDEADVRQIAASVTRYAPQADPAVAAATGPGSDEDSVALRAALYDIVTARGLTSAERHRRASAAVVEAMLARGRLYRHADQPDHASAMYFDSRRKLLLGLQSDRFLSWLAAWSGIGRAEASFAHVAAAVADEALVGRATELRPESFFASRDGAIYLSNGDGLMAKVTAAGTTLADNGTDGVLFAAGATLAPWTLAGPLDDVADPFALCSVFSGANMAAGHGLTLFKLWALSLPTAQRCKPPLVTAGPVGSGKTRIAVGLAQLYGLPINCQALTEGGEEDFWSAINAGGLLILDNADTRLKWLPDALAAAATDAGRRRRKLYTDGTMMAFRPRAWVAVTSANPSFAADAGLSDRLLVCRMERRVGETAEARLTDEIAYARDGALTWVCQVLSAALADDAPVPAGLNKRHPDWGDFAVRLGRALGDEAGAVAAVRSAELDKANFNVENDDFASAIVALTTEAGSISGTASDLLEALRAADDGFQGGYWSAKKVGKRLDRIWPHLSEVLITDAKIDGNRKIKLYSFAARG